MNHSKQFGVSAIVAMAKNRVIGYEGDIPWKGLLPGEQLLFKKHTKGKAVIMGRKTYYSIPEKFRPLPGRLNLVLTSNPKYHSENHVECSSIVEALLYATAHKDYNGAVIIGGQRVYEEGLMHCDTLYISHLDAIFKGDTYFPELNTDEWEVTNVEEYSSDESRSISYKFKTYRRK